MKTCRSCGCEKELSEFYAHKRNKDGLHSYCKACMKARFKAWGKEHPERVKQVQRDWRIKNKEHLKAYTKEKRSTEPSFKLAHSLRVRLNGALKRHGRIKNGSAVSDLGCSLEELKLYLEGNFKHGMTWENYGKNGWHIDHVKPLAVFDLTDRKQFKEACHYTNLQPMWASDNFRKGARSMVK